MKKIVLAALFVLAAPFASATVFLQGNATTDSGFNSDFDVSSLTFAPEFVDSISITKTAQGFGHDHGTGAQGLLQIYNGVNWVTVDQFALGSGTSLSTIFANPVTFMGEMISGLRLSGTGPVHQMYHSIDPNMTFTTSGTASAVPEPASIALFGLGLLGFAAARRKSAK